MKTFINENSNNPTALKNMNMGNTYFKDTFAVSLFEEEREGLKGLSLQIANFLNEDKYNSLFKLGIDEAKKDFIEKLEDAKRYTFNQVELTNWLLKFREDAEIEFKRVEMEARRKDYSDKNLSKCLDFKKYGRFIGFFNYAEIYIDKIRAIKPKNESLPFYEILDRLEKIDQEFIERNSLPGYYHVVDADASYHHEFDLIKFNDAYSKIDSSAILLSKYHGEFAWKLHKIAPREKVINYLDYHLSRFSKEKEDFVGSPNLVQP